MMLGIFNVISVSYLQQGHGNRKTRGPAAWAMPNEGLYIYYESNRDKMLGNISPGWAGFNLGWQQGPAILDLSWKEF